MKMPRKLLYFMEEIPQHLTPKVPPHSSQCLLKFPAGRRARSLQSAALVWVLAQAGTLPLAGYAR